MDLSALDNSEFERGASRLKEFAWLLVRGVLFDRSMMPWYAARRVALRTFGAEIADGVVIKPGAKITFPWKLKIGANSWIGEDAWLLNLESTVIGANVCVSQRAMLCTGNHDWSDPAFKLNTGPVVVEDGAWIGAGVLVAPGVTVGRNAVATLGSVVTEDLPPDMICSGAPCRPVKPRQIGDGAA